MVANRVSLDQRFRRAGDCPICEGGDSMKRQRGARCWGYEMRDGNAVVCTQIASPHASGNGYVHVLDRPCDCGEDHSAGYRPDPLPRAQKPVTPAPITRTHKRYPVLDTFDYRDADGVLRFRVAKFWSGQPPAGVDAPKCLPQRPDGADDWIDGLGGAPYAGLFMLPELLAADPRRPVFIPEGEPCVKAIAQAGGVATCNAGGADCWREEYNETFRGRHVVILADADKAGRRHAQQIADALTDIAASVRLIELEGAHDVADWLADGHTYGDLLEITACTLPAQYSTHAPQDDPTPQSQKTESCPNCRRWADRAKIAETTVANMRREKWREDRLLSIDNEKLSAPEKVAALAIGRELSEMASKEGVERNEQGMPRLYRGSIAHRTGVKEKAAGVHMQRVAKAGLFQRDTDSRFQDTAVFMAPTPLYESLDPQAVPTPERANGWGGKRVKACPHCLSPNITATNYVCNNCGCTSSAKDLISIKVQDSSHAPQDDYTPDESEASQDGAQHDSPPLEKIVGHLATPAQDEIPGIPDHPQRPCIRCRAYDWRWTGERWACGSCLPEAAHVTPYGVHSEYAGHGEWLSVVDADRRPRKSYATAASSAVGKAVS